MIQLLIWRQIKKKFEKSCNEKQDKKDLSANKSDKSLLDEEYEIEDTHKRSKLSFKRIM